MRVPRKPEGEPNFYRYRQGHRDAAALAGWEAEKQRRRDARAARGATSRKATPPSPPDVPLPLDTSALVKAVRAFAATVPSTPRVQMYVELLALIASSLATTEPKDRPKVLEQLVDTSKLIAPQEEGSDDGPLFPGLGTPT